MRVQPGQARSPHIACAPGLPQSSTLGQARPPFHQAVFVQHPSGQVVMMRPCAGHAYPSVQGSQPIAAGSVSQGALAGSTAPAPLDEKPCSQQPATPELHPKVCPPELGDPSSESTAEEKVGVTSVEGCDQNEISDSPVVPSVQVTAAPPSHPSISAQCFERRRDRSISGTMIDKRFIEVVGGRGHVRTRSLAMNNLEEPKSSDCQLKVPMRPSRHQRNVSVSLSGENTTNMLIVASGYRWRSEKVVSIAKDYLNRCFDLQVSRDRPVELDLAWACKHMPKASVEEVCKAAVELLSQQPTLVEVAAPCKVYGDIHGQFSDLLLFFNLFGQPQHHTGDIEAIEYVFLGDFVDRGKQSVETVLFLYCLKVLYP